MWDRFEILYKGIYDQRTDHELHSIAYSRPPFQLTPDLLVWATSSIINETCSVVCWSPSLLLQAYNNVRKWDVSGFHNIMKILIGQSTHIE